MEFIEFIKLIEYRPGMYLGMEDLNLLRQYINGFIFCYEMNCKEDPIIDRYKKYFSYYVQEQLSQDEKYKVNINMKYNNGMGYVELIELVENNKELQLKVFFSLFNNFVQLNDPRIFESLEKKYNPIF